MNYFFCRFFPGAARLLLQLFAGCVHVRKKRKKNGKTHNQYMLLLAFEFGHSINHRVCVENKWRQYCANRAHFLCIQCTQKNNKSWCSKYLSIFFFTSKDSSNPEVKVMRTKTAHTIHFPKLLIYSKTDKKQTKKLTLRITEKSLK